MNIINFAKVDKGGGVRHLSTKSGLFAFYFLNPSISPCELLFLGVMVLPAGKSVFNHDGNEDNKSFSSKFYGQETKNEVPEGQEVPENEGPAGKYVH